MSETVIILDFEASGLEVPDSYPIEAGWARLDLSSGDITSDGMLIRPDREWTHWNHDSFAIHGISRTSLEGGEDPVTVVDTLDAAIGDAIVLCDGGRWDEHWVSRLFDAAHRTRHWPLERYYMFMAWKLGGNTDAYTKAVQRAKEPRPHRAEADARILAEILRDALVVTR